VNPYPDKRKNGEEENTKTKKYFIFLVVAFFLVGFFICNPETEV